MSNASWVSRDEALLLLNDRCGKYVEVSVDAAPHVNAINAAGILRHWRGDDQTWAEHPREDITGLYYIGDVAIDVTDLDHAQALTHDTPSPGALRFALGHDVTMTVTWGGEDDDE